MSNAVATVAFLQGQAWAKAPDGSLRALTVGSVLHDDEVLVTAEGAQVQLDTGSGDPIQVNGGVEVAMSRDFTHSTATDPNEAALDDASVQEALTVLEQGGDLLEELEETAAGNNAGGGSDGNNGFVQLTRILEETDSQSFNYQSATPETIEDDEFTDGAPINAAPSVTDQSLVGNEDEVIGGRIIATDIEGDNLTYTLATGPVNGVLTLSATSGQFMFTPNANFNGGDSFVVTVTDSRGNSTSTTVNLTVVAVNDAPTASNISLSTNEDSPVSGQVIAQDIEADVLAYSVTTNPANGTVTLNPATGAFIYTPNANYNGSDSFIVTVNDGKGGTTTSTVSIGVLPVNDVPVAGNDTAVVSENSSVVVAVRGNDTDADGNPLTVTAVTQGTNGSVVIDAITGNPIYTPNAGFNGSDSFTYTISDGNGGTSTATVNVTVAPVNDVPVANDDSVIVNEDDSVTIAVRSNDIDADGHPLTVTAVTQGTNGSVVIDAITGNPIYTPNAGFNGSDSFTYTISDNNGGTSTATVNVTVTPVNDVPVANDDSVTVNEDDSVTIAVRGNDTDADGNPLTVTAVTQGANGSVVIDAITGNPIYTPNAGFNGSDSFTYTIGDNNGGTSTATVNVTVTPVNDVPVANDDSVTVNEDDSVNIAVRSNDTDADGHPLTVTAVTQGTNGSVVIDAITGNPIYTPNAGFNGSDSFTYTISDGNGGTATATVNVTVTPVNDAPVANDDSVTVNEDDSVVVAVRGNDTDADGNPLTVTAVTQGANGSVVIDAITGNPIYTPNAGFNGSDSFTYTISDNNGGTSTATVNVTVTPVNDAPVANDDSVTVNEDDSVVVAVRGNDTDADGNPLTVTAVTQGTNGSVVIDAITGNPIYTPNAGFNGSDSFTYTISDGNGGTATATVNVTVTPVNDAPVANDDSVTVNEDDSVVVAVRGNDTDADGNPLTVTAVTQGTNGSVVIDAITGNPVYTPNAGFNGSDSFTYTISDNNGGTSTATVNVTVTPVNDVPVANDDSVTVNEDDSVTIAVRSNDTDADGNPLTVTAVTQGANGSVVIDAITGNPIYTPNAGFNGSDSFTYTISDNNGGTATATVNVTVAPVNDAPVAVVDTINVIEGGTSSSLASGATSVLANDSDPENDTLSAILVTGPQHGSLTLNADGTFTYVHNGSETTADSFQYRANDGTANSNIVTVNIVIAPQNDAPQTNAAIASGNEDTLIPLTLSGSDVDGTVTGFVIKSLPANSVLYSDISMTSPIALGDLVSGSIYFMPNANWNGNTNFTFAARDNGGLEDPTPATASITVNPMPDAAVLGAGTGSVKEDTPAQSSASGILTINDPDAGQAVFIAQTNVAGTYGSFSVNASGAWAYNLDNTKPGVQSLKEGEIRSEVFNVQSQDGTSTTVTITVTGTNDLPVANADTASMTQGGVLTLTPAQLLGNDTDLDADALTLASVGNASSGTVSIVSGNVQFTPAPGFSGPASFTYTVSDGHGTATGTVSVTVLPNATPDAVNDPSGAVPYSVAFGDLSATDNWTNLDSKGLTVNIAAYSATGVAGQLYQGSVDGNNNVLGVLGTPRGYSDAPNQIEYNIGTGQSESIVMTFNGNLNQASFGVSRLFPGENGGEIGLWQAYYNGVLVASNTFRLLGAVDAGSFTIDTGSTVFNSIKFSALHTNNSTGDGGDYFLTSFAGTGPASVNSSLKVTAGASNTINAAVLLANDIDADNDTLSIASVQGAVNGTVTLVGGNAVFTPTTGYTGPASFTYTVSDGRGGFDTATVNLIVERTNTAPNVANDSAATAPNTAITIATSTLLANDSDAQGDAFTLTSVQGAVNGSVSLVGPNVVFTPISNYEGPASFTYTVRDALGATSTATVNIGVGAASAPSVVVSKALVVNAHGTGGASIKFPITTELVDTDGSETLSIRISGVPTNLSFNAGTNLGGGVWQFTEADLPNLTLNVPGSYTTNSTSLTVQVISTETNGGFTASTSTVVTLKAAYTTVDVTTTDPGSYTGSSASEFIQGGTGNNTINASTGNNIVYGGAGNDNLSAGSGSDVIFGESGNDSINAGSGSDRISGGSGNDTLQGGDAGESFVDVFVWTLGDQGAAGTPAVDTINNFATAAAGNNTSGGDVLDLRDLLQGESVGASNSAGNLANYLHFEVSGGSTIIHVSHTGGFGADSHSVGGSYTSSAETQQIVLNGVNLQTLYSGATTDQQIITQLLNNNKLITD
ncbi:MAG TPA: retention module-containing protein [Cellvibrio sp.]|nr:retention module-containing protein [Cellvibrio sp.]